MTSSIVSGVCELNLTVTAKLLALALSYFNFGNGRK